MSQEEALRLIQFFGDTLRPRSMRILALMDQREREDHGCDEAELVREGRVAYLDLERVASSTVDALLRACSIKLEQDSAGSFERYRINETGRAILARRRERK